MRRGKKDIPLLVWCAEGSVPPRCPRHSHEAMFHKADGVRTGVNGAADFSVAHALRKEDGYRESLFKYGNF